MNLNINITNRALATVAVMLIGGSFFTFKLVSFLAAFQNAVGY